MQTIYELVIRVALAHPLFLLSWDFQIWRCADLNMAEDFDNLQPSGLIPKSFFIGGNHAIFSQRVRQKHPNVSSSHLGNPNFEVNIEVKGKLVPRFWCWYPAHDAKELGSCYRRMHSCSWASPTILESSRWSGRINRIFKCWGYRNGLFLYPQQSLGWIPSKKNDGVPQCGAPQLCLLVYNP